MKTIAASKARDAKTVAARIAHGGSATHCPTCTRPNAAPYRSVVDGKLVAGCIDAAHSAELVAITSSFQWHFRPAAIAFRAGK